jgi:hypothetical protein
MEWQVYLESLYSISFTETPKDLCIPRRATFIRTDRLSHSYRAWLIPRDATNLLTFSFPTPSHYSVACTRLGLKLWLSWLVAIGEHGCSSQTSHM